MQLHIVCRITASGRMEKEGQGCAPRTSARILGSLVDGDKQILFKETDQDSPGLILECRLAGIEPFGIQLMTPARFHTLTIIRSLDRRTTTVTLQVDEHGPELQICTSFPVCTHIPLPYLARIAGIF